MEEKITENEIVRGSYNFILDSSITDDERKAFIKFKNSLGVGTEFSSALLDLSGDLRQIMQINHNSMVFLKIFREDKKARNLILNTKISCFFMCLSYLLKFKLFFYIFSISWVRLNQLFMSTRASDLSFFNKVDPISVNDRR